MTIKITNQVWLQELDPTKYYVMMFKGYPPRMKWEDKPANVSNIMLSADKLTLEDLDEIKALKEKL